MKPRSSIRWRLTVFYGVSFALCGCVLLFLSYRFVSEGLLKDEGRSDQRVVDTYGYNQKQVNLFYSIPTPSSSTHPEAHTIRDVIAGIQADIRNEVVQESLKGSLLALGFMLLVSIGVGW